MHCTGHKSGRHMTKQALIAADAVFSDRRIPGSSRGTAVHCAEHNSGRQGIKQLSRRLQAPSYSWRHTCVTFCVTVRTGAGVLAFSTVPEPSCPYLFHPQV